MGVGWTLDGVNFLGGTLRMLFFGNLLKESGVTSRLAETK